ncbi:MAG: nucleotidyltransferase domain-containing protein [Ignavibacteriales bacterium]|jgi:predicted nucleotidyltransferase|nr:nucleotidyltransferase domain-containing protein [Ignavibacteriales bacterium]
MRLSQENINLIKNSVKEIFDENSKVFLFGSRTDDQKKGGDIDLYIETQIKNDLLQKKLKLINTLHKILGEQKIDIVINNFTSNKYIYEVAKHEGIQL